MKGSHADYRPEHASLVQQAGYKIAFTSVSGANASSTDPLRLRRYNVEPYPARTFELVLAGACDLIAVKDTVTRHARTRRALNAALGTPRRERRVAAQRRAFAPRRLPGPARRRGADVDERRDVRLVVRRQTRPAACARSRSATVDAVGVPGRHVSSSDTARRRGARRAFAVHAATVPRPRARHLSSARAPATRRRRASRGAVRARFANPRRPADLRRPARLDADLTAGASGRGRLPVRHGRGGSPIGRSRFEERHDDAYARAATGSQARVATPVPELALRRLAARVPASIDGAGFAVVGSRRNEGSAGAPDASSSDEARTRAARGALARGSTPALIAFVSRRRALTTSRHGFVPTTDRLHFIGKALAERLDARAPDAWTVSLGDTDFF